MNLKSCGKAAHLNYSLFTVSGYHKKTLTLDLQIWGKQNEQKDTLHRQPALAHRLAADILPRRNGV